MAWIRCCGSGAPIAVNTPLSDLTGGYSGGSSRTSTIKVPAIVSGQVLRIVGVNNRTVTFNYNVKVDENLIKLQKQKEYAITSARWCHVIMTIILLIWNLINVIKYGVEEAINRPEFIIMNAIGVIYFTIYIFQHHHN